MHSQYAFAVPVNALAGHAWSLSVGLCPTPHKDQALAGLYLNMH